MTNRPMRWVLVAIAVAAAAFAAGAGMRPEVPAQVESGRTAIVATGIYATSGLDGTALYVWDTRDPEKSRVTVLRVAPPPGTGSYRQDLELAPIGK